MDIFQSSIWFVFTSNLLDRFFLKVNVLKLQLVETPLFLDRIKKTFERTLLVWPVPLGNCSGWSVRFAVGRLGFNYLFES